MQRQTSLAKAGVFLDKYSVLLLSFFTVAYIVFVCFICLLRYRTFDYADFDLAVHAQTVYNILYGSIQSSILGIPFLGNHLNLILFLIVPIYAIFSTPLTLLFIQALFVGLGVVPLYLLAKEVLDRRFAFWFCILYLLFPALTFIIQYEFHPVSLTIFFILFMFYYFEKSQFMPFVLFMFLSLLCKENISVGIFFFGLYVLLFRRRKWKWSIVPLVISLIWLIVGVKILRIFNPGTIDFHYIYRQFGSNMPEVVSNILRHPGVASRYIFAQEDRRFLFQLFFPLGCLSLLSPKILFIGLPFFLQQLLSMRLEDHSIEYHYAAKLIPFLFISAIYGLRNLLKSKLIGAHKIVLIGFLVACSVISNVYFGLLPKIGENLFSRYVIKDITYIKQKFINRVPRDSSVVATFEFLPQLSQRKELYSFHHFYIGKYTLSQKKYELPKRLDYALIDFNDYLTFAGFYSPEQYNRLQEFFASDNLNLIDIADSIALFKREGEGDLKLYQILGEATGLDFDKFLILIEDNAIALGYNIENRIVEAGGVVPLSFFWQCRQETEKDFGLAFALIDKEGKLIRQYNHPVCYNIYPTFAWQKDELIKENVWLFVPRELKSSEIKIKMLVLDRGKGGIRDEAAQGATVKVNADGLLDSNGWLNLGRIEIKNN